MSRRKNESFQVTPPLPPTSVGVSRREFLWYLLAGCGVVGGVIAADRAGMFDKLSGNNEQLEPLSPGLISDLRTVLSQDDANTIFRELQKTKTRDSFAIADGSKVNLRVTPQEQKNFNVEGLYNWVLGYVARAMSQDYIVKVGLPHLNINSTMRVNLQKAQPHEINIYPIPPTRLASASFETGGTMAFTVGKGNVSPTHSVVTSRNRPFEPGEGHVSDLLAVEAFQSLIVVIPQFEPAVNAKLSGPPDFGGLNPAKESFANGIARGMVCRAKGMSYEQYLKQYSNLTMNLGRSSVGYCLIPESEYNQFDGTILTSVIG